MRFILPILVGLLIYCVLRYLFQRDPNRFTRVFLYSLLVIIPVGLVLLALKGHFHWLVAIVAGVIPFLRRSLFLLRAAPFIAQVLAAFRARRGGAQGGNRSAPGGGPMTRAQALAILGLKEGASREEIMAAYKRMMQKCHPDQGGSDFLAAQLNEAKEVLLGK